MPLSRRNPALTVATVNPGSTSPPWRGSTPQTPGGPGGRIRLSRLVRGSVGCGWQRQMARVRSRAPRIGYRRRVSNAAHPSGGALKSPFSLRLLTEGVLVVAYRGKPDFLRNAGPPPPGRRLLRAPGPSPGRPSTWRAQASTASARFKAGAGFAGRLAAVPGRLPHPVPFPARAGIPCAPRRSVFALARVRSSALRLRMAAMRSASGTSSRSAGRFP
jgi:hypothetical protein